MEKYLVTIYGNNASQLAKAIEKYQGVLIEKENRSITFSVLEKAIKPNEQVAYEAILDKQSIEELKKQFRIEIKGNLEELGRAKQSMVGKGNRYIKN